MPAPVLRSLPRRYAPEEVGRPRGGRGSAACCAWSPPPVDHDRVGSHGTRVAVDVGGTFTDVVSLDPVAGVLQAWTRWRRSRRTRPPACSTRWPRSARRRRRVAYFVHGTTLALNALLTRTGAKVAIVTTQGFRDIFEPRPHGPRADVRPDLPQARAARAAQPRVRGRASGCQWNGTVLRPVDAASVRAVAAQHPCRRRRARSPVSLLHSYANPAHELEVGAILAARAARRGGDAQPPAAARVPRVRAHQHRGPRRLRQAGRAGLPRAARGRARRARASRAAS